jgi:hypothetical protein
VSNQNKLQNPSKLKELPSVPPSSLNVTQDVNIVNKPKENVPNVLKTDITHQNVHVKPTGIPPQPMNVYHVTVNALPVFTMVKLMLMPQVLTVLNVPLTDKVSQLVDVQEDIMKLLLKLTVTNIVMSVEMNVLLVLLGTSVQNVTTDISYMKTCVT